MSNNSHGMTKTPEYNSWQGMKNRCFNSNDKRYSDWGGRGISVCDRWLNFENFFADMGLKPSPDHSIDRIDNNGDYSAENCKWSTRVEQANNKSNNRFITIGCVTLNIMQWSKEMSFGNHVIRDRLKLGWSEYDAVMTPLETVRLITFRGETRTIVEWERKMGYNEKVIKGRLRMGWSEEKAILTPMRNR